VTITGEAKNSAEKDLVTKIAENIDGVRSVRNDMTVQNR
jgi:osmotically-inducible protein OsmY